MKSIPTPHQSSITRVDTSLVLRVCRADHTSHDGFQWPDKIGAEVIAPDWEDNQKCGHGLHGWLFGQGDHNCIDYWESPDAMWYVLEVQSDSIVNLDGKCKFPRAVVRFIGARSDATNYLFEHEPRARDLPVIGLVREVGDYGAVHGGAFSTLKGGDHSSLCGDAFSVITGGAGCTIIGTINCTLTGGNHSVINGLACCTITGKNWSVLTGSGLCLITGEDRCTIEGGHRSTITGGDHCTLVGESSCIITGGIRCAITGGEGSRLVGRAYCTITGGMHSLLAGGSESELHFRWYDSDAYRFRTVIAYVGEDGIEPGVFYTLDADHKVIRAQENVQP